MFLKSYGKSDYHSRHIPQVRGSTKSIQALTVGTWRLPGASVGVPWVFKVEPGASCSPGKGSNIKAHMGVSINMGSYFGVHI